MYSHTKVEVLFPDAFENYIQNIVLIISLTADIIVVAILKLLLLPYNEIVLKTNAIGIINPVLIIITIKPIIIRTRYKTQNTTAHPGDFK